MKIVLLSILLGLIPGGIIGGLVAVLAGGKAGTLVGMAVTYMAWKRAEDWIIRKQEKEGFVIFRSEDALPRILLIGSLSFVIFLAIWYMVVPIHTEWVNISAIFICLSLSLLVGFKVVDLTDKRLKNTGFIFFAKENRIVMIIGVSFIVAVLYVLTWIAHDSQSKILRYVVETPVFLSAIFMISSMIYRIWYAERDETKKESKLFIISIWILILASFVSIAGSFFTQEQSGRPIALLLVDLLTIMVLILFRVGLKKMELKHTPGGSR